MRLLILLFASLASLASLALAEDKAKEISVAQQAEYTNAQIALKRAALKRELAQAALEEFEAQMALQKSVANMQAVCPLTMVDGRPACAPAVKESSSIKK